MAALRNRSRGPSESVKNGGAARRHRPCILGSAFFRVALRIGTKFEGRCSLSPGPACAAAVVVRVEVVTTMGDGARPCPGSGFDACRAAAGRGRTARQGWHYFFRPQAAVEGGILHRQMRTLSWPIWNLLQIRITRRWRPLLCTFTYIETKAALDTSILSVKATTRGPLTWSPRWPQPSLWWASPALSWHTWSGSPCGQ